MVMLPGIGGDRHGVAHSCRAAGSLFPWLYSVGF